LKGNKLKKILSMIWRAIAVPIAKLNQKYDTIKEPKRVFVMLIVVILPLMILNLFGLILDHKGFTIFALLWASFLIIIRMWWIEFNLRDYLQPK
jgi:hypothetical protein